MAAGSTVSMAGSVTPMGGSVAIGGGRVNGDGLVPNVAAGLRARRRAGTSGGPLVVRVGGVVIVDVAAGSGNSDLRGRRPARNSEVAGQRALRRRRLGPSR